ncbi:MAG: hypothetical protein M0Z50_04360 [Planctomycetia bacterium]|nr:hypothetical protein [Planctomycetia bacterium]
MGRFRSTIRHIATGYAGSGVFNGNANREVITVPFLIVIMRDGDLIRSYPVADMIRRGRVRAFLIELVQVIAGLAMLDRWNQADYHP